MQFESLGSEAASVPPRYAAKPLPATADGHCTGTSARAYLLFLRQFLSSKGRKPTVARNCATWEQKGGMSRFDCSETLENLQDDVSRAFNI